MNFINWILSLFGGGGPKRSKFPDLSLPMSIGDGCDYVHDSQLSTKSRIANAVKVGLHGLGREFGFLMNTGPQGEIHDMLKWYDACMDENVAFVKACDAANLVCCMTWDNTNARADDHVDVKQLHERLKTFITKIGPSIRCLILTVCSEDNDKPSKTRKPIMDLANTLGISDHLCQMDSDSYPWRWKETHMSRHDTHLPHREDFIHVTDNPVTIYDNNSAASIGQLASSSAHVRNSHRGYGKLTKIYEDKCQAAAAPYAGLNN